MDTSDWIASGSALIALTSLGYTVFFARTQHKLNKILVAEKEREQAERRVVSLRAELIKETPQNWILRTTNVGQGAAYAVTVRCAKNEDGNALLEDEDIDQITPVARLDSAHSFDIKATNWYGVFGPQSIQYNWNDEDGTFCSTTLKVLIH
ncbi:hypothetical protein V9K97_25620 [Variovorax sp. CCNWLW186]|uniref:hypothetical protein n=1 Tax=Variovorax sp. CCNWLW186 TaxID=3127473 RepID=UPI003077876F